MEFLEPIENWTCRKGHYQNIHPKAGRDFSLLPPTYLLLFELNQKAGSRREPVLCIDMHRTGQRRMGGEAIGD